ncbi:MAG: hypothetical protein Q9190_004778, partial [Brigantiaea leucoxantha]
MAGHVKKATKKFEKNRLRGVLERRKDFAKTKQRHQIRAKKKARNAEDYAKIPDEGDTHKKKRDGEGVNKLSEMSVDQFFEGSFDIPHNENSKIAAKEKQILPKTGKRKRDMEVDGEGASTGASDVEELETFSDEEPASGGEDRTETHKEDLDALAKNDPEFYKFLQENDAELLEFGDFQEVDGLSEDEAPNKKVKTAKREEMEAKEDESESEVTMAKVEKWKNAMEEQHSLRAMRQVVLAFRAAAYVSADDGKEHKYTISNPEVYHQVMVVALHQIPEILDHHLPVKELPNGRIKVAMDSKKYRTLTPLLKSHSTSVINLLENLSDAPTIKLTLSSLNPLLPYILSFKKVLRSLVKATVVIWSDTATNDSTRITAFLLIRRLAVISDASIRTAVLKTAYQGLIKGSRLTNPFTLPSINLMKNSAAELWGLDANIGYTTGFVYIRQLAVHLRQSITHPTKDSYKQIYNWQYTHSLDF